MKLTIYVSRYIASKLGTRYTWYIFNEDKEVARGMMDMEIYDKGPYTRTFDTKEKAYNYALKEKEKLEEFANILKLFN